MLRTLSLVWTHRMHSLSVKIQEVAEILEARYKIWNKSNRYAVLVLVTKETEIRKTFHKIF
jgi:hypothetical protein